jgi:hypothetical protein
LKALRITSEGINRKQRKFETLGKHHAMITECLIFYLKNNSTEIVKVPYVEDALLIKLFFISPS